MAVPKKKRMLKKVGYKHLVLSNKFFVCKHTHRAARLLGDGFFFGVKKGYCKYCHISAI